MIMNKRRFLILLAVFSIGIILTLHAMSPNELVSSDEAKAGEIKWVRFDEGIELSRKKSKMLVIDFYTDWCSWCKVMDEKTYGNKEVIEYASKNLIMAKLNAETNEEFSFRDAMYTGRQLSMMFGVTGFPTTVFMNEKGELLTSVPGYLTAEKFMILVKYLSENWYEKMKFDEFEKKEKAKRRNKN